MLFLSSWSGPAHTINFDNSLSACIAKGTGHHMVTLAEWAYLSLLAIREGFQPRGNDSYGDSYQDATEYAIAASASSGQVNRTRTGSGPLSWFLDGTPFSGRPQRNVLRWLAGIVQTMAKFQILQDNNAADGTKGPEPCKRFVEGNPARQVLSHGSGNGRHLQVGL